MKPPGLPRRAVSPPGGAVRLVHVDFYCPAARLVVEVDGGYHTEPVRKRADARRDSRLAKAGYRVVRVSADLVLADAEAAVAVVREGL
jgi:very-short-patch-repair endonuclease